MHAEFDITDAAVVAGFVRGQAVHLDVAGPVAAVGLVDSRVRERNGVVTGWALFAVDDTAGRVFVVAEPGDPVALRRL